MPIALWLSIRRTVESGIGDMNLGSTDGVKKGNLAFPLIVNIWVEPRLSHSCLPMTPGSRVSTLWWNRLTERWITGN